MKTKLLLAATLSLGLLLPACDSRGGGERTGFDPNDQERAQSLSHDWGQREVRQQYNPVRLGRVGIDEPASTMDGEPLQTAGGSQAVNPQIHRIQDTTPVGKQIHTRGMETNRYYHPITSSGKLANQQDKSRNPHNNTDNDDADTQARSLQPQLLQADSQLGTFASLLALTDLGPQLLKGQTVFAPTDTAFAQLPVAQLAALKQDKAKLRQLLLYHLVDQPLSGKHLSNKRTGSLMGGKKLVLTRDGKGRLHVNKAHIIRQDLRLGQGYLHLIDKVLMPPGFTLSGS